MLVLIKGTRSFFNIVFIKFDKKLINILIMMLSNNGGSR